MLSIPNTVTLTTNRLEDPKISAPWLSVELMLPKTLGPFPSNSETPACFRFSLFSVMATGSKKKNKDVWVYISNLYHSYWISHDTFGLKLQRHQLKMAWLVGNALAHIARSLLGIGLIFKADLSELLSALSSPWGLALSSGCLSLWYQSNCKSFSLICSLSIQKKRDRGEAVISVGWLFRVRKFFL